MICKEEHRFRQADIDREKRANRSAYKRRHFLIRCDYCGAEHWRVAGSFLKKWPGCSVRAYEPSEGAFRYLGLNTKSLEDVFIINAAVLSYEKKKLFRGSQNDGQYTFFEDVNPLLDGTYETPEVVHPYALPQCDILKLDTEGAELDILLHCTLPLPDCILLEYHRESDRRAIDSFLSEYNLIGSHSDQPHRGVVKYLKRNPGKFWQ